LRASWSAPLEARHGEPDVKILIAEDQPIDAIVIRNILEHAGHVARVVGNGRDALEALESDQEIAVVVADVRMPAMGGVELLRAMRERTAIAGIPVVFVSGAADAETVREAVGLGPAGYILKPVTEPSRVLDCVEQALRRSGRQLPTS
jgi:CheY-like chemotaxis protein